MKYTHSFSRVFILLIIIILFFSVNGCKSDNTLVLVKDKPLAFDGGELIYVASFEDSHYITYVINDTWSAFTITKINNTYRTSLMDDNIIRSGKKAYPNFNITVVGFEKPVKTFKEVKYIRHEKSSDPAWVKYLPIESTTSEGRLYEYYPGLEIDGERYYSEYSYGNLDLSENNYYMRFYGIPHVNATVTFDSDKVIISGGVDAVLRPGDVVMVPHYVDTLRVQIIEINESWMSDTAKRSFDKRNIALSGNYNTESIRLVESQWTNAGSVWLSYKGSIGNVEDGKSHTFHYRFGDEGKRDGIISFGDGFFVETGDFPVLFNISIISVEDSVPSSKTVAYLYPGSLKRGDIYRSFNIPCEEVTSGLLIDGENLIGCLNDTMNLSSFGLDYQARSLKNQVVLVGDSEFVLSEGEEITIPIEGEVVVVELIAK